MRRDIESGDRVKYAAKFLRSISCHTGPACFVTGTVTAVKPYAGRSGFAIVTVAWDDRGFCDIVASPNLVRVEDMHRECID